MRPRAPRRRRCLGGWKRARGAVAAAWNGVKTHLFVEAGARGALRGRGGGLRRRSRRGRRAQSLGLHPPSSARVEMARDERFPSRALATTPHARDARREGEASRRREGARGGYFATTRRASLAISRGDVDAAARFPSDRSARAPPSNVQNERGGPSERVRRVEAGGFAPARGRGGRRSTDRTVPRTSARPFANRPRARCVRCAREE
jgi:hypothetical protein